MSSSDKTMIPVTKKVREKLKELGNKGDTYTDIINRLLISREE